MQQDLEWLKLMPYVQWTPYLIDKIPTRAGVYFVTDDKCNLLYIGKALNLQKRLRIYDAKVPHEAREKAVKACNNSDPYLRWIGLPKDETLLLTVESALIYQYQPLLNIKCKYGNPLTPKDRWERADGSIKRMAPEQQLEREKLMLQRSDRPKGKKDEPCPVCNEPFSLKLSITADNKHIGACRSCGYQTPKFTNARSVLETWCSELSNTSSRQGSRR